MTRYAAFLRGVNVGGVNLKMAEVAAAFRAAGFSDVVTVLASGNVLLTAPGDAEQVRATAEAALSREFRYEAWVLVYAIETVRAIFDGFPFDPEAAGRQSYVTFVSDPAVCAELGGLTAGPDEDLAPGDGVIYWQVPKGSTLTSAIGATMGRPRYKSPTTTRNLRTLASALRR